MNKLVLLLLGLLLLGFVLAMDECATNASCPANDLANRGPSITINTRTGDIQYEHKLFPSPTAMTPFPRLLRLIKGESTPQPAEVVVGVVPTAIPLR